MSKPEERTDRSTVPTVLEPPAPAEWIPLDALVEQWADFARHPAAMNALALELISDALLALAAEMSAQQEYSLIYAHGCSRGRSHIYPRGLDECIAQLSEACTRWSSVLYWLEYVNDPSAEVRELVRTLTEATCTQQRRVGRLLLRVQEEQVQPLRRQEGTRP